MRPSDERRVAVVAAALLTALLPCCSRAGAASGRLAPGRLDGVQLRDGRVELVLTAAGLPAGTTVDPATAQVLIGGRSVPATVGTSPARSAVERRLVLLIDVSGSMRGTGIDAAKAAAAGLISQVARRRARSAWSPSTTRAAVLAAPTTDRRP